MKKGQIVLARAEVITEYLSDNKTQGWKLVHEPNNSGEKTYSRCLYRLEYPAPTAVILLGKTSIQTGVLSPACQYIDDYEPAHLRSDKHHKVWAVVHYSDTDNRYTTPFYVLESDINI
jgi:hypothetical protein